MRSSPRPLYVSRVVGSVGIISRDVSSGDGSYPWLCARAGMLGGAAEGGRSADDESALRLVAERVLPVGEEKLDIPLIADAAIGDNWNEAH